MRFKEKSVIVTGGALGIGGAASLAFAREGANVTLMDVNVAAGNETAAKIGELSGSGLFVEADAGTSDGCKKTVDATVEAFGGVDILFNNAGISGFLAGPLDYPDEEFDRIMAINVRGVFLGMKYVGNAMKETGGSIVNTSSISGFGGGGKIIGLNRI